MAIAFDRLVMGPCLAAFGETVTYTPQGRSAFALTVVFDEAAQELSFQEGAPASTVHPMMGVRLSDFPAGVEPQQGDAVLRLADNTRFAVKDVQPDGLGAATLDLQVAV